MAVNAHPQIGTDSALANPMESGLKVSDAWRSHHNSYFLASARSISVWTISASVLAHAVFFGCLWHAHVPTWRILVALGSLVAFLAVQVILVARIKNASEVESAFHVLNTASAFFTATLATMTGGMLSPAAPSLVLPAMLGLLFLGPLHVDYRRILFNVGMIFAVAAMPASVTGGQLDHGHYVVGLLAVLILDMHVLYMVVKRVTDASSQASDAMQLAREARIAEAEEQTRRLQSVASKVAHELKNPLASIKGLCQLVARSPHHERTAERLAVAEAEIDRMEHILAEYLTFARPLEDLRLQPVDIADIARDVVDVLDGRAATAGVALVLANGPAPLAADPRRMREALINLVGNAIEATPAGGTVTLTTRSVGSSVEIEVLDTGRGIPSEDLARIGTSFFTTRANGTGLGVVLATNAVTQHGGTLRYRSNVGTGTAATIELPRRPASEVAP